VDGACVPDSQFDPLNECRFCDSTADAIAWTPVEDATPCGIAGFCIFGECVGQECPDHCPPMVEVPAGSFWMGANKDNTQCPSNSHAGGAPSTELPCREVSVPAFEIDKHLVTVRLYRSCVDDEACSEPDIASRPSCNWAIPGRDLHPVTCITWYQAREFCAWAGKRLCAEAEWEKASRGTDGRIYPWGSEAPSCELAVMNDEEMNDEEPGCGAGGTMPIGSKPRGASPYGVMDMSGNTWELLEDDWHETYEGAPTDGSPWIDDPRAEDRVVRGGSWLYAGYLHSSARTFYAELKSDLQHSVRCCR
jgi:formylglycine-generating enzyme required for sulfatase activity